MARQSTTRTVHVHRGQRVELETHRGRGKTPVRLTLEVLDSGAIHLRNTTTNAILRSWAPKE